jgi:two-component sensor histidine kinase
MLQEPINLIEELDNLSKVHWLDREDIDVIMTDFAKQITQVLRIERVNAWLFNPEKDAIISIGEYDKRTDSFKKDSVLNKADYPTYFKALEDNKMILAENIHTNRITREFDKDYSVPFGIESLLDVPLRIAGELVGVLCFEKTGVQKKFSAREKSFANSVALVLASTLEARQRRAAQHQLDKLLHEKDLLIKEINHRVKNNFSILVSLLRLSKAKARSEESKILLDDYEQRLMSMIKIQDMLYQTKHYTSVSLTDYLKEILAEFKKAHPEISKNVIEHIDIVNCYLPTKDAIHTGLIVTEIFLNSLKHAYFNNPGYKLYISLSKSHGSRIHLKIGDNGPGFNFSDKLKLYSTMGAHLIKDLADGLDLSVKYPTKDDSMYEFVFTSK